MTLYKWSQIPSADATADPTINWSEGQAPSSINDSARAMMAAVAKYRDDISGAIVTSGSASNYTISTYEQFDSAAHMNGQAVAFTPHVTNTGAQAFINVDGLGLKTIRLGSGLDVPAGTLVAGTPYEAVYSNSDGVFYLKNFYNIPYIIPIGATLDFWGAAVPNSSFVFPSGQAISRAVYATLFGMFSTTYGSGDGSTTFNLPDLRGRVTASPDNMGGGDAARLAAGALASQRFTLGAAGGESAHTLTAAEIPSISSIGSVSVNVTSTASDFLHSNLAAVVTGISGGGSPLGVYNQAVVQSNSAVASSGSGTANVSSNNTGGGAHNVIQPTLLCNRIMRII